MRKASSFLFALAFLALMGCNKVNSAGKTSTAGGTAMKSVNDTLSSVAKLAPGTLASGILTSRTNVTDWTTAQLYDPRNSGGSCTFTANVSPQTYMQIDFTESATRCNGSDVNVFGRLHTAMKIGCFMMNMFDAATSDALPSSGTQTILIDTATATNIATNCKTEVPDDMKGIALNVTFEVPADTTLFDRKMTLGIPGTTDTFSAYVRFNDKQVAISGYENNSNGSNRSLVELNKTSNVLRAEYVSMGVDTTDSTGYLYLHRLFYDQTNDVGRVFSSIRGDQGSSPATMNRIHYIVTGKPQTDGVDMAMGLDFTNFGSTAYTTDPGYNLAACVSKSAGTLTSEPTPSSHAFTCTTGSTSVDGVDAGAITADGKVWTFTRTTHPTDWYNLAVPAFSWTGLSDMYTADFN